MEGGKKGLSTELIVFLSVGVVLPLVVFFTIFIVKFFSDKSEKSASESMTNQYVSDLKQDNRSVERGLVVESETIFDRMVDGRWMAEAYKNQQDLEELYGKHPLVRRLLDNEYWIEEKVASLNMPDFDVIEENISDPEFLREVARKFILWKGYARTYCQESEKILNEGDVKYGDRSGIVKKKGDVLKSFCKIQEEFFGKAVERYMYHAYVMENLSFDQSGSPIISNEVHERLSRLRDEFEVLLMSWVAELGKLGQLNEEARRNK